LLHVLYGNDTKDITYLVCVPLNPLSSWQFQFNSSNLCCCGTGSFDRI